MVLRALVAAVLVASLCAVSVGQMLKPRPPVGTQPNSEDTASKRATENAASEPVVVPMTVEAGTPIKVALDSEVRVREVGQAIHGKTTEPVYAFDKLLIPVGTVVNGKVSAIDAVPKMVRTMQATNGNFLPPNSLGLAREFCAPAAARKFQMKFWLWFKNKLASFAI